MGMIKKYSIMEGKKTFPLCDSINEVLDTLDAMDKVDQVECMTILKDNISFSIKNFNLFRRTMLTVGCKINRFMSFFTYH